MKILLAGLLAALLRTAAADLHVSPQGDDGNPGTAAAPFRTMERALQAAAGAPGTTIWIGGGEYRLRRTLELDARHSGVSLRAPAGERARLSGGEALPVDRFVPVEGAILSLDLRALGIADFGNAAGTENRLELVFNGRPLQLARWPNDGLARDLRAIGSQPFEARGVKGDRSGAFAYDGERHDRWRGEKDAWLHGYWFYDWHDEYQRIERIDATRKVLHLDGSADYGYRTGARYYALNARSELDQPGEWYLDRERGVLYLWPPAPLAGASVVLSMLNAPLVRLDGASRVALRGLLLEAGRSSGVEIRGGEANLISDCEVRNVGRDAIVVAGGRRHRVEHCTIEHVGAAAITLSGGDRATLERGEHAALRNRIRDYARARRTYAAAVRLEGVGHRVANNDIAEAPHLAIWFSGNDHVIEQNEIHDVVRETDDAGAIYTGRDWTARGTVIRRNYIHDVHGVGSDAGQAIYLDDMASGIVVVDNILRRVDRGILAGGGRDNVIEDNRMLECRESIVFDDRGMNLMKEMATPPGGVLVRRLAAMPVDAPPWSARYPQLARLLDDEPGTPKDNIVRGNSAYRCGPPWLARPVARFGTVADNLMLQFRPFGYVSLDGIGLRDR